MTSTGEIYRFAAATRIITILLGIISYLVTGSYDTSTEIILPVDPAFRHLSFLNIFIRWDAIYFLHIAEHGYVYEQETAFFPLLPYLTNYLAQTVFVPLQSVLGKQYTVVVVGALISNVSFILAAVYLYKLTRAIYPANPKLAKYSAIGFCLSLPSMFLSAFYTESIFALLSFMGMYYFKKQNYLFASLLWGLASLARSNAIVYVGFFIYEFIISRYHSRSVKSLVFGFLRTIWYSLITVSGFTAFQYSIYLQYCDNGLAPERPWCSHMPPLVYTFVQKEYWGNGFLAYFEFKQIPNFLLAMPVVGLSICGLWHFASKDWTRWCTLGQINHVSSGDSSFSSNQATVYMYLWAFLLFYATTCMHVQVILRFFTALPPLYWYLAHLWSQGFRSSSTKYQKWTSNILLYYFVMYSLVGIILFSAFLPPA